MLVTLFLLSAAFLIHNIWTKSDRMARANDQAQFMKNITLAAGALLFLVAHHRRAL